MLCASVTANVNVPRADIPILGSLAHSHTHSQGTSPFCSCFRPEFLLDSGSEINLVDSSMLVTFQRAGVFHDHVVLRQPLTALLADCNAFITFTHGVTIHIVIRTRNAVQVVPALLHVHPDPDARLRPLLGWPLLQEIGLMHLDLDPVNYTCVSFGPFHFSGSVPDAATANKAAPLDGAVPNRALQDKVLATVLAAISTTRGPPHVDLSQYAPPTAEELLAIDTDNERAFLAMRARFTAHEKDYVNPEAYIIALQAIDSMRDRFSTVPRPQDVMRNVHVPVDRLVPGERLPYIPGRTATPAKMAALRKWASYYIHAGVLRPATTRGPAPAPSFVVGSAPKERVVHDTKALKSTIAPFNPPDLTPDEKLSRFAGFQFGSKLDIAKAFYSIECNPDTPEELRQISIGGDVFTSERLIMGSPNSSSYLVQAVHQMLGPLLYNPCIPTADDIALPACGPDRATAEMNHALALQDLAARVNHYCVTLNPNKCELYTEQMTYCGNTITPQGITRSLDSITAVTSARRPTTGGELASLYYGAQWCARFIPNFARDFRKIKEALEAMYGEAKARTSKSITNLKIADFGITTDDVDQLTGALRQLALLAHRRPEWALILMSDASNVGYGGVLLQVPPDHVHDFMNLDVAEPLAFFGGTWAPAQSNYPVHELEALAVLNCINSGWYIINDGTTLQVLTDNKSLSYLFDPSSSLVMQKEAPGRNRLLRWIAAFNEVNAEIRHIPGVGNHLADFLSRATVPTNPSASHVDHDGPDDMPDTHPVYVSAVQLAHALRTVSDPSWRAPTLLDISAVHGPDGTLHEPTNMLVEQLGLSWDPSLAVYKLNSRIFVPDADHIRTKLLVLAHCGEAGHHGVDTMLTHLGAHFTWPEIKRDASNFTRQCIHCMTASQHDVKRPYGSILRGTHPNHVVSLDYVFVEESDDGFNRILIITDTFTNYSIFELAASESAEDALGTIRLWCALFGTPDTFVMDSSAAFTSHLTASIHEALGAHVHITTAHAHGAHGRQEALNRVVTRMLRALLSEYQLPASQWPKLIDLLCSSFNNFPVASLAGFAPIELFTGLPRSNPVAAVFNKPDAEPRWLPVDDRIHDVLAAHLAKLHTASEFRTRSVHATHERNQAARAAARLQERNVTDIDFAPHDWVLVRRTSTRFKYDPQWQIARIVAQADPAHPYLWCVQFESKNPARRTKATIHVSRLAKFAASTYQRTPELDDLTDYLENKKYLVEHLLDLRVERTTKVLQALTKWIGYEAPTWEPLSTILQDSPSLVQAFLDSKPTKTAKKLLDQARRLVQAQPDSL